MKVFLLKKEIIPVVPASCTIDVFESKELAMDELNASIRVILSVDPNSEFTRKVDETGCIVELSPINSTFKYRWTIEEKEVKTETESSIYDHLFDFSGLL